MDKIPPVFKVESPSLREASEPCSDLALECPSGLASHPGLAHTCLPPTTGWWPWPACSGAGSGSRFWLHPPCTCSAQAASVPESLWVWEPLAPPASAHCGTAGTVPCRVCLVASAADDLAKCPAWSGAKNMLLQWIYSSGLFTFACLP